MRSKTYLFIILFIISFLFLKISNLPLYDDESAHYGQIKLFYEGNYRFYENISVIPLYHLTLSLTAKILRSDSVQILRAVSFIFTLLSVIIFYKLSNLSDPKNTLLKTAQFAFLPIFFPYRFLLYVENLAVLLLLISLYFLFKKRYFLSSLFFLMTVASKQIYIVWLPLFMLLPFIGKGAINWRVYLRHNWLNFVTILLFIIFMIANRGVAIGTQDAHPDFFLSLGNLYWALFLFFVFFLPLIFKTLPQIFYSLKKYPGLILAALLFLTVSWFSFHPSHPWNQFPEHLRNLVLMAANQGVGKFLFLFAATLALLTLCFQPLLKREYYVIYPLSVMSLAAIWLIESRYALPAFILFLLFRKTGSIPLELLTLCLFMLFSGYLYWGYLNQLFYF